MSHIEDEGTSCQRRRRGLDEDKLGKRRTWTTREEESLVNVLNFLASGGWKCDNGFRNGYLVQLENYMNHAFPNCGIKAKPHIVMASYDITHMQIHPTAKKMRYKSWPYFPAWCQIFGKDRATREPAEDVHKAAAAVREEEQAEPHDYTIPTAKWNPKTPFVDFVEEPPMANTAKHIATTTKKHKADKVVSELPKLVEVIRNYCASANNTIKALTRVLENEFGDPVKRGMVLEAVKQLTVFDEDEQLLATVHLYKHPKTMELFFTLSTESRVKLVRLNA